MATRYKENIAGRFYVDTNCINCSLCAQIAPNIFVTNHDEGYEYVHQQPGNNEENALVAELIEICPANAIQDNG
ncbi:MAG: ferredoxin [Desulfobacteraceae bacterium]|nr:ferredoxin [Desulfobacteraceae bacterium]